MGAEDGGDAGRARGGGGVGAGGGRGGGAEGQEGARRQGLLPQPGVAGKFRPNLGTFVRGIAATRYEYAAQWMIIVHANILK